MKNSTRIALVTVVLSLVVGLVIHEGSDNASVESPVAIAQESPGPPTTVADTLTEDEYRAAFRRLNALSEAGLVPGAKMPLCCDPTHTMDPTLDQTLAEPDGPELDTAPPAPDPRRALWAWLPVAAWPPGVQPTVGRVRCDGGGMHPRAAATSS